MAAIDYTNTTDLIYSLFNCVSDFNFTYRSSPGGLQAEKTGYEAVTGYSSTHLLS